MNILDSEEMTIVQKQIISHQIHLKYSIKMPNQQQILNFSKFQSSIFPIGQCSNEPKLQKIIPDTENIKTALQNDCNAILKLFSLSLLNIIYHQSTKNNSSNYQTSLFHSQLLQSIKCSFYSNDLDLKEIKNFPQEIDNLQAKAMIARFFHYISNFDNKNSCLKCIEWILQNNRLLLDVFVLFLRAILHKLEIEDANNFQCSLDLSISVTNLIEYFDMKYRNYGDIFLFYEESQFLAKVKGQLIFGSYFQSKKIQPHQQCIGNDKTDYLNVKNFQLLWENDRSMNHFSIRQSDIETPHFMENSGNYNFGKRKKEEESQNHRLTMEFHKLMDSSSDSISQQQVEENYENIAPQEQFTRHCNFMKEKQLIEHAEEIIFNDEIKEIIKNPSQNRQKNAENIVYVKDKSKQIYTPKIGSKFNKEMFSSINNDIKFLNYELNKNSFLESGNNLDSKINYNHDNILYCQCTLFKKSRFAVTSQVVTFTFNPRPNQKNIKFPTFFKNMRASELSTNQVLPKIKITPPKRQQTAEIRDPLRKVIRQQRKPTFLKFLKKEKDVGCAQSQTSKSKQRKFSKQSLNHLSKYKSKFEVVNKSILDKINDKYTYFATVLNQNEKNIHTLEKRFQRNSSSPKRKMQTENEEVLKKYDPKNVNCPTLTSQPCTWKPNQHSYLQTHRHHLKANHKINTNMDIKGQTCFKNSPNNEMNPFPFSNIQHERQTELKTMKSSQSYKRRISPTIKQEKVIDESLIKRY